jgi:hypothetical protein
VVPTIACNTMHVRLISHALNRLQRHSCSQISKHTRKLLLDTQCRTITNDNRPHNYIRANQQRQTYLVGHARTTN